MKGKPQSVAGFPEQTKLSCSEYPGLLCFVRARQVCDDSGIRVPAFEAGSDLLLPAPGAAAALPPSLLAGPPPTKPFQTHLRHVCTFPTQRQT